jgi:hypothetical protein
LSVFFFKSLKGLMTVWTLFPLFLAMLSLIIFWISSSMLILKFSSFLCSFFLLNSISSVSIWFAIDFRLAFEFWVFDSELSLIGSISKLNYIRLFQYSFIVLCIF